METALHFPPCWPGLQVPQLSSRRRKGSLKPQKAGAEEKSTHIYPNIMSQLFWRVNAYFLMRVIPWPAEEVAEEVQSR